MVQVSSDPFSIFFFPNVELLQTPGAAARGGEVRPLNRRVELRLHPGGAVHQEASVPGKRGVRSAAGDQSHVRHTLPRCVAGGKIVDKIFRLKLIFIVSR